MKIENFKAIVLVNLVVMSLFLTYNIWTYQYRYSPEKSGETVQNVSLEEADKQVITDIIKPTSIVYHLDNKSYASQQLKDINLLGTILERGSVENVKDISENATASQVRSLLEGTEGLEFVYPISLPMETMKKMLMINERNFNEKEINRVFIDLTANDENDIPIYFLSISGETILRGELRDVQFESLVDVANDFKSRLPETITYTLGNEEILYLPKDAIEMKKIDVLTESISTEKLKTSLFSDTEYLKSEMEGDSISYTDGIRLLTVNNELETMYYRDPSVSTGNLMSGNELIQKSIDFVNGHNGWTNAYYLENWNEGTGNILFREHLNGIPIFGSGVIEEQWGSEEKLLGYSRSTYKLGMPIQSTQSTITMSSGEEVVNAITQSSSIEESEIRDIILGYEIETIKDTTSEFGDEYVELTPVWCVKYGSQYYKMVLDDTEGQGGELSGLE